MTRSLIAVAALCVSACATPPPAPPPKPKPPLASFVVIGDNEGVAMRKQGQHQHVENPYVAPVLKQLRERFADPEQRFDWLLHTGDVVRFDEGPEPFLHLLGPELLPVFYPTSGGDEECQLDRYDLLLGSLPHLSKDTSPERPWYHRKLSRFVHLVTLENPDHCEEHRGLDLERGEDEVQLRWLDETLGRIRAGANALIIVLGHQVVFGKSPVLTDMMTKHRVDLVLSGDAHVLAHQQVGPTLYLVSGAWGDYYLGGCQKLEGYEACVPADYIDGFEAGPRPDHLVNVTLFDDRLELEPVFFDPRWDKPYPKVVHPLRAPLRPE